MRKEHIVVTLTSFPDAIEYAEGAIRSVLAGSVLPDKVVIYLTLSDFKRPGSLTSLEKLAEENDIFEIRNHTPDIHSYQKLIPALRDFPESVLVTIDDDVRYHRDMLLDLLRIHRLRPTDVIANRIKRIDINRPYREWKKLRWYDFLFRRIHDKDFLTLQTGVGGVLYPPHSLDEDMVGGDEFLSLAPTADDIWFWAAATARGTKVIPVPFGKTSLKYLGKPDDISLKTINYEAGEDRNIKAFRRILNHYPSVMDKVAASAE